MNWVLSRIKNLRSVWLCNSDLRGEISFKIFPTLRYFSGGGGMCGGEWLCYSQYGEESSQLFYRYLPPLTVLASLLELSWAAGEIKTNVSITPPIMIHWSVFFFTSSSTYKYCWRSCCGRRDLEHVTLFYYYVINSGAGSQGGISFVNIIVISPAVPSTPPISHRYIN